MRLRLRCSQKQARLSQLFLGATLQSNSLFAEPDHRETFEAHLDLHSNDERGEFLVQLPEQHQLLKSQTAESEEERKRLTDP